MPWAVYSQMNVLFTSLIRSYKICTITTRPQEISFINLNDYALKDSVEEGNWDLKEVELLLICMCKTHRGIFFFLNACPLHINMPPPGYYFLLFKKYPSDSSEKRRE